MRRVSRKFIKFVNTFASREAFIKALEKRGYHVVETRTEGDHIFGWCIYIRNLPREVKAYAKTMNKIPGQGETIHWQLLK